MLGRYRNGCWSGSRESGCRRSGPLHLCVGQRFGPAGRIDAVAERLVDLPAHVGLRVVSSGDAAGDARQLYRWLHELDASDADLILVVEPPDGPQWLALRDRLQRAAGAG